MKQDAGNLDVGNLDEKKMPMIKQIRQASASILAKFQMLQAQPGANFVVQDYSEDQRGVYTIRISSGKSRWNGCEIKVSTKGAVCVVQKYKEQIPCEYDETEMKKILYRTNIREVGLHWTGLGDVRPEKLAQKEERIVRAATTGMRGLKYQPAPEVF